MAGDVRVYFVNVFKQSYRLNPLWFKWQASACPKIITDLAIETKYQNGKERSRNYEKIICQKR